MELRARLDPALIKSWAPSAWSPTSPQASERKVPMHAEAADNAAPWMQPSRAIHCKLVKWL